MTDTAVNGRTQTKGNAFAKASWSETYAPAPETVKVAMKPRYGNFINGKWYTPLTDRPAKGANGTKAKPTAAYFPTINPATEAVLAEVAQGTGRDVDAAVSAARKALPAWAGLPPTERAKYLFRIARRIQERSRELAVLETMDSERVVIEGTDPRRPVLLYPEGVLRHRVLLAPMAMG